jgi:hypothetical protein
VFRRPAAAFALLAFAQLIISLDYNIVYVALPEIGDALRFSTQTLQWVVGTHQAYDLLVVGNAVSCAASAVFLVRLTPVPPVPAARGPRWAALPLWLIEVTTAPRWLVSATMLLNTAIVVAFQVRASRGVDTPLGRWPRLPALGLGLAEALGPGLVIALCVGWGRPGWYVLGILFTLTGLGAQLAVRRAGQIRRPAYLSEGSALL